MYAIPAKCLSQITFTFMITCFASIAMAHSQAGSLGDEALATDIYLVYCDEDTERLEVSIADTEPVMPPLVSVTISKERSKTTTDPVDADGVYSKTKKLKNGAGQYALTVSKSDVGAENYDLQFHCMAGVTHTETAIQMIQNQ